MTTDPTTPPPADAGRLSDEDLTAIRERMKGLAKGPWWVERQEILWQVLHLDQAPSEPGETEMVAEHLYEQDAHFVAHARFDVPALLREVDRLRAKLASIDGVLQKCDRGNRDGWPGALVVIAEIIEG